MKNFTCLILVAALIGCAKEKNTDQSILTNYKFEITDSIRVNHLEELTLIDFYEGKFLAKKELSDYFIIDETGTITSHIELKTDGPNAINMAYSAGFFERKFYVYEELDEDLIFKKSVSLNVKDHIPFPQANLQNTSELFSKLEMVVPSMIEQLYVVEDKIILIYKKGASENIVKNYDRENQTEWMDFFESLPKYAAVFDSDYKLLQDDIELPSGAVSTPVVDKNGQIFIQKNQRLLGEEDWNTYYLLKLINGNKAN